METLSRKEPGEGAQGHPPQTRGAGGHLAEAFALHFQLRIRTYGDASTQVKMVPEREA